MGSVCFFDGEKARKDAGLAIRLCLFAAGIIGVCASHAVGQDTVTAQTTGVCSPIIVGASSVILNCSGMGLPDVPVYSAYISLRSFSMENADFMDFLSDNLYGVVYLRLKIDEVRAYTTLDEVASLVDACGNGSNLITDDGGRRLLRLSVENYVDYASFPPDELVGESVDELVRQLDGIMPDLGQYCSSYALSIEADGFKELVDRGSEVVGFFFVNDIGGHLTWPVIRVEERSTGNAETQALSDAMRAAEQARLARIDEYDRQMNSLFPD